MKIGMIGMNIYLGYYFHLVQHSKWQPITFPTSWSLMYGLHPLMLTEYILPSFSGGPWDPNPVRVLMSH
jgi:hypothetical protein